eukprot:365259-Chlamydomonas_euryale.AAC.4
MPMQHSPSPPQQLPQLLPPPAASTIDPEQAPTDPARTAATAAANTTTTAATTDDPQSSLQQTWPAPLLGHACLYKAAKSLLWGLFEAGRRHMRGQHDLAGTPSRQPSADLARPTDLAGMPSRQPSADLARLTVRPCLSLQGCEIIPAGTV